MYKEYSDLKDKRILVVGLGKTGVSLAHFLVKHQAQVSVTDHKSKPELSAQLEQLADLPIKFELGGHSPKTFIAQDLVVLSPGVPSNLKIFPITRALKELKSLESLSSLQGLSKSLLLESPEQTVKQQSRK